MESSPLPSTAPRSHRESVIVNAEELLHPLEVRVFQLSQELTQTDLALSDDEVITKLNMCVTCAQLNMERSVLIPKSGEQDRRNT